jgi:hypothetical protein
MRSDHDLCGIKINRVQSPLLIAWCATTSMGVPSTSIRVSKLKGTDRRLSGGGELTRADELAERDLALGMESGQPDPLLVYGALMATIRYHQGRFPEFAELIALALADNPGVAMIRAGLLVMHFEVGDIELTRSGFEREADAGFVVNEDILRLTYLCFMSHACARLGERAHAETLLALLEPQTNRIETSAATAFFSTSSCAGMLAALLGRDDEADRYFSEAIELTTNFRFPYLIAAAQLEWVRSLLGRTPAQPDRAQPLLEEAIAAARRYGFGGLERDAQRFLDARAG